MKSCDIFSGGTRTMVHQEQSGQVKSRWLNFQLDNVIEDSVWKKPQQFTLHIQNVCQCCCTVLSLMLMKWFQFSVDPNAGSVVLNLLFITIALLVNCSNNQTKSLRHIVHLHLHHRGHEGQVRVRQVGITFLRNSFGYSITS